MMKDGFVYIWRNEKTDQLYIGSHQSTDVNDGYIGSGRYFRNAYDKNPDMFERIAVQMSTDCRKLEEAILKMLNVKSKDRYYNLTNSAIGVCKGSTPWNKGIPRSDKVKEIISRTQKGMVTVRDTNNLERGNFNVSVEEYHSNDNFEHVNKGKTHAGKVVSNETKQKISNTLKGRTRPDISEAFTEKRKQRYSKRMSGKNNPMYGLTGSAHPSYGRKRPDVSKRQLGEKNSQTKLSKETVLEIRAIPKWMGFTQSEIADSYDCSVTCITNILNNKTWSHL